MRTEINNSIEDRRIEDSFLKTVKKNPKQQQNKSLTNTSRWGIAIERSEVRGLNNRSFRKKTETPKDRKSAVKLIQENFSEQNQLKFPY
jgi:hypothetical protein